MPRRYLAASLGAALAVTLLGTRGPLAHGRVTDVTWTRDIAPIVQRRCAGCHAPARIAALSLIEFEGASRMASRIKTEVLARHMPPWHATPGFGDFANDPSLTAHEAQLLVSWADGGTPKGAETDRSLMPFPSSPHATPDLVLDPGAETPVVSRRQRYVLHTNEKTDRWIHGWDFRPGNQALVKQARIALDSGEALGVWVPPGAEVFLPDGVAQRLPAGASLIVDVEYVRPASDATDRSRVALFFGAAPKGELRQRDMRRGTSAIGEAIAVLALRPHLESSGESVRVVAHRPDGTSEPLLWVREYDDTHQLTYRLRRPVILPAGTSVQVFSFDASAVVELEYVSASAQ